MTILAKEKLGEEAKGLKPIIQMQLHISTGFEVC